MLEFFGFQLKTVVFRWFFWGWMLRVCVLRGCFLVCLVLVFCFGLCLCVVFWFAVRLNSGVSIFGCNLEAGWVGEFL